LWSLLFIVAHLLFYRRFFLQFEFFLLPFAGIGFDVLWKRFRDRGVRVAFLAVLLVQLLVMRQAILSNGPLVDETTFRGIMQIGSVVPADAFILVPENNAPVIVQGWYPHRRVGGPGLFDAPWSQDAWRDFLLGTHADRVAFLQQIQPGPVFLFITPFFRSYYGEYADAFLKDPFFEPVADTMLYRV